MKMSVEDAMDLLRGPGFADLCRRHRVTLAVLFGSKAKGQATDASDIDLAVSMDEDGRVRDIRSQARQRKQFMKDVIAYLQTSDLDLVILDHANALLRFEIAKVGKPIYEETQGSFPAFCSLAVRQHEDSKVFYLAMDRYLKRAAERGR